MEAPVTEHIKNNGGEDAELPSAGFEEGERRLVPRIEGPFPALVVVDVPVGARSIGGHPVLEDLSADGFYLRLSERLAQGAELLVTAHISHAVVVMRGTVVRVEELEDDIYGLAVAILQYRIFSETLVNTQISNDHPLAAAEFLRA